MNTYTTGGVIRKLLGYNTSMLVQSIDNCLFILNGNQTQILTRA